MATVQQASSPGMALGGYAVYDVAQTGWLGPTVINAWSVLGIPAYWRAMSFISANMATFPRSFAVDGVDRRHPLTPLITRRPNGYQSAPLFWRTLFFHRSHAGNGYARIERDRLFRPVALHGLMPETVTPFRWTDDSGVTLGFYHLYGSSQIVAAADMIHLAGMSYDGIAGINPVAVLCEAFERSRNVDRYMTRYLTKGTVVKGSVEIPTGASPEQVANVVDTIRTKFMGPNADRDVLVLTEGAKLNNATLSAQDTQLMEQAGYATKQIAQITGVPAAFLFDLTEGKYNGSVEESYEMVVRDLFRPLIEQDEAELSAKLLTDGELDAGWSARLDPSALIRGNATAENNAAIGTARAGIRTANEARSLLGLPKSTDPDADKLKVSGDTSGGRPPGGQGPTAGQGDPPADPAT